MKHGAAFDRAGGFARASSTAGGRRQCHQGGTSEWTVLLVRSLNRIASCSTGKDRSTCVVVRRTAPRGCVAGQEGRGDNTDHCVLNTKLYSTAGCMTCLYVRLAAQIPSQTTGHFAACREGSLSATRDQHLRAIRSSWRRPGSQDFRLRLVRAASANQRILRRPPPRKLGIAATKVVSTGGQHGKHVGCLGALALRHASPTAHLPRVSSSSWKRMAALHLGALPHSAGRRPLSRAGVYPFDVDPKFALRLTSA